jgi:glycosyltransferase involved in cell wall biosynthesis
MTPAISVICLCFNHERYVAQAIRSILNQTLTDFELIVVDDGSSDRSCEIIRSFADPRIRLVSQENRGPGYASWRGIAVSRGGSIALMSADDACEPGRLEAQFSALASGVTDLHFCRPSLVGENDEPLPDSCWPIFYKRDFATQGELFRSLFFKGNFLCATSLMLRREVIERHGWVHTGLPQLQDLDLWVRFAPFCRFLLSDERLIRYRVRSRNGNLSSPNNKWRNPVEMRLIYRTFFDRAPRDFLYQAFDELRWLQDANNEAAFKVALAKLYLRHKTEQVRLIGIERLMELLGSPATYDEVQQATGLTVGQLSSLLESAVGTYSKNSSAEQLTSLVKRLRRRFRSRWP